MLSAVSLACLGAAALAAVFRPAAFLLLPAGFLPGGHLPVAGRGTRTAYWKMEVQKLADR